MTKAEDVSTAGALALPPWSGHYFTKTSYNAPPSKLDARNVKLSRPFVVCITGGGRGLGEAYAIAYAQAGASHIVIAARSVEELESVKAKVQDTDSSVVVTTVRCDVTSESSALELKSAIQKECDSRLDVLVNNAGFLDSESGWKPITEGDPEGFRQTLAVNVFGVYLITRTLLPLLLGTEGGAKAVVGITSFSSHFASYSISMALSKLALNRFVEFLDKEYREQGLVAYALHPGGVATKMSTSEGVPKELQKFLISEATLSSHMLVWLTREKRQWLSGRYVASTWDVDELEGQKEEIVKEDKLKFRMVV
ncbi:NAD(P)-binding protein [Lophiostoma macrostomum CBS 122681]|uniref:NAD(P)-binding protein n=1 Tax=Lophiostoma macrostomum CBS 122681 TaxID=1314788 RepID=A0A6A6T7Y1_9PLEO|nr:NAD(P)-binding protein [Lophiostoma macrostomum CBS 122681]